MKNEDIEKIDHENTYNAPVGKKFNKVLRALAALDLAALLAVGGTFLTSCKDNTPSSPIEPNPSTPVTPVDPVDPKPVDPVDPKPEDPAQKLLETSTAEYNKIVSTIKNANSLTTSIETTNGDGAIIFEIQDNKLKSTQNKETTFVETTSTQTFEYSLQENQWHKNLATDVQTARTIKTSLCQTLEGVKWSSAKQEEGKITLTELSTSSPSKTSVSCQYNIKDNSLSLKTQSQIMSVYDVNNTLVELPAQFVDDSQEKPPVEEGFKITADNIEEMKEKMRHHVDMIRLKTYQLSTLKDVYCSYLTKSENSKYVDTIGAVFTMELEYGDMNLIWAEIQIPTQEDITFEKIYKEEINYTRASVTYNGKFAFAAAAESNYVEMVDILKSQTFGENYKDSEWTGWYGIGGVSIDTQKVVSYNNNVIQEVVYGIYNNGQQLNMSQAVKQNFKNREESDKTYYTAEVNTYDLKNNNRIFLEIEQATIENNI